MDQAYEHPIAARFVICEGALSRLTKFDSIIKILREIENIHNDLWALKSTENQVFFDMGLKAKNLVQQMFKIFWTTKDLKFHMKVMKAVMKPAVCMNIFQVNLLLDRYAIIVSPVGAQCLKAYAWFQNSSLFPVVNIPMCNTITFHEDFVQTSVKYSTETKYFALAIENYISAYDIGQATEFNDATFSVILTNLENAHQNVHRLLLDLFKRMMKCYGKSDRKNSSFVYDIWHLPWTNRNKYKLLAIIIGTDVNILVNHKDFDLGRFHEGIQVGLTMHNLYAPSQSLIKSMQKKEIFEEPLIKTTIDILWGDNSELAENLHKFWLSAYDSKLTNRIFKTMIEQGLFNEVITTSPKYHRLLMLCNTSKTIAKSDEFYVHVFKYSTEIKDLPTRIEIFHLLVDQILTHPNVNIQIDRFAYLLNFLRIHIISKESSFIEQYIMRRLPDVFNLIATQKFRYGTFLRLLCQAFQGDIIDNCFFLGSYESVTFGLKFLNVAYKQYFSSTGFLLSKNTNVKNNLEFGKYLEESKIWELRSPKIFKQLIWMTEEDEHSDLGDLALNILVEYFIKPALFEKMKIDDTLFIEWIKQEVTKSLQDPEISSNAKARRYFVLKFECIIIQKNEVFELLSAADMLKTQFMTIYKESDPVKSMEEGLHLFKLMDCINYGLKRVNPEAVKSCLIPVLNVLLKNIALHFVNFFCDEKTPPSFDVMHGRLCKLMEASKVPNALELKPKLVQYVWYTLRSTSDMTKILGAIITKHMDHESKEFNQFMNTYLVVNIEILKRCCHKGVIDSASEAIGANAKLISDEWTNLSARESANIKYLHSLLVTLKKEIFANKRAPNASGDIRSSRGLIVMAHKIISSRPVYLKFLMETLLVPVKVQSFEDTKSVSFKEEVIPIQLHLLAALIRDGGLAEEMVKYLDFILLATFKAYKHSNEDYVKTNALLQIIGAIVPKIANQKRSILNHDETDHYEAKAVSCYEFYVKFTYSFRIALFDLEFNVEELSSTYIIILLEIFSNFEYRNTVESWSEIEKMRSLFRRLMLSENRTIRMLAAKCYAYWHEASTLLEPIAELVPDLASKSSNIVQSASFCIRFMLERYESCLKAVVPLDMPAVKKDLRKKIYQQFEATGFPGLTTYFIRTHFVNFMLYLGFPYQDYILQALVTKIPNTHLLGYEPWASQMKNHEKLKK